MASKRQVVKVTWVPDDPDAWTRFEVVRMEEGWVLLQGLEEDGVKYMRGKCWFPSEHIEYMEVVK